MGILEATFVLQNFFTLVSFVLDHSFTMKKVSKVPKGSSSKLLELQILDFQSIGFV